jgi:hypothetical protein
MKASSPSTKGLRFSLSALITRFRSLWRMFQTVVKDIPSVLVRPVALAPYFLGHYGAHYLKPDFNGDVSILKNRSSQRPYLMVTDWANQAQNIISTSIFVGPAFRTTWPIWPANWDEIIQAAGIVCEHLVKFKFTGRVFNHVTILITKYSPKGFREFD